MGGSSSKSKGGFVIWPVTPFYTGSYKATFQDEGDYEIVKLDESKSPNSYYLAWKNKDYTEGEIDLENKRIEYFFTAQMSGCSLWYKIAGKKVLIRHESRPDFSKKHQEDDFSLIFDTNIEEVSYSVDESAKTKVATFYFIYAIIDHDEAIEFKIQKVSYTKSLITEAETYSLKKTTILSIPLPSPPAGDVDPEGGVELSQLG